MNELAYYNLPSSGFRFIYFSILGDFNPVFPPLNLSKLKSESPVIESKNFTDIITGGDILNIAGNAFSGVAPYLNTLENLFNEISNEDELENILYLCCWYQCLHGII